MGAAEITRKDVTKAQNTFRGSANEENPSGSRTVQEQHAPGNHVQNHQKLLDVRNTVGIRMKTLRQYHQITIIVHLKAKIKNLISS